MTLKTNIPTLAWQKQKDDKIMKKDQFLKIENLQKTNKNINQQNSDEKADVDVDEIDEYPDQMKLEKTP